MADAGLVLEPDLDRLALGQVGKVRAQLAREVFFIRLDDLAVLARMTRAGADVGEAEFLQQRPDVTLVIVDAEAFLDELWRSTRRQRTTPSTAGSGPVLTIRSSSAFWTTDRRGWGPPFQASLNPSGPFFTILPAGASVFWSEEFILVEAVLEGGPIVQPEQALWPCSAPPSFDCPA